jgi:sugar/nucleoside kinase (ribokinase family)
MTVRVVCIGIATLDAVVVVDRLPGSDERVPATDGRLAGGGVAATAAVTLARLGVPVGFVGRVGDDPAGRLIRDGLAGEGVDVGGLRLDAPRSPVSAVLVEAPTGLRSLAPFLGEEAPIALNPEELDACAHAEWIHVDELGLGAVPALQAAGVRTPVSLDDGTGRWPVELGRLTLYGPTARVLAERFPGATVEASAEACLAAGPSLVATTLGADGSAASERDSDGRIVHERVPGFDVEPVSTLGAGDVFHGALLAALVERRPLGEALRFANAVSALSCRALDGRSAIPSRAEVDTWLAADPPVRGAAEAAVHG